MKSFIKLIRSHKLLVFFSILAAIFISRSLLFAYLIDKTGTEPKGDFDLVMTYSEGSSMDPALDLALAHHKPLYVSQAPGEKIPFLNRPSLDSKDVYIDKASTTTDQNARHAVPYLKKMGYKRVVVDAEWSHLPRAYFLTQFYLGGTGITVAPCLKALPPAHWWLKAVFYKEVFKFWGSLGRMGLAAMGWETGPTKPPTNH